MVFYNSLLTVAELSMLAANVREYYVLGMAGHTWNYDREQELFVDLTLDQFYAGFPQVAVLPASFVSVLRPKGSLTHVQRTMKSCRDI